MAELVFASSHSLAGRPLREVYPTARADIQLVSHSEAESLIPEVDLVFLCLPHGTSAEFADKALSAGRIVIDLSADFRLEDAAEYAGWYGVEHPHPKRLEQAVYGLSEFARSEIARTDLIANPGCYASSILLALLPLWQAGAIGDQMPIIADSKSGVSGAGRKPQDHTHFVAVNENFGSYSIGRQHRHLPEMTQCLSHFATSASRGHTSASDEASGPDLIFSPHLLPVSRGILSTIYLALKPDWTAEMARNCLETRYANEAFIRVLPEGEHAELRHVVRSNRVVIGIEPAGKQLILTSSLDNLVKGAAGQAVQNMNIRLGIEETMGLEAWPQSSTGASEASA